MGISRAGFDRALRKLYDTIDNKSYSAPSVPSVAGLSMSDDGFGQLRKVKLTFKDVHFALTDVAGTVAYSGKKILDLPEGSVIFVGAWANLALTKSSAGVQDTWNGDFSVGTVTAAGDATLTSSEANLIPSTATPQAVTGATTAKGVSTTSEAVKVFDGTGTALDVYLNLLVDDANQDVTTTPCDLIVNGTVEISYINIGDK